MEEVVEVKKKTLVLGASTNPARYAYQAVIKLRKHGHEVIPFGIKPGEVDCIKIITEWPIDLSDLDTITLYIGPGKQDEYYQKIIDLKPKRVIFNPGTENEEFYDLLKENGIEVEEACTLVKLTIGNY